MPDAPREGTTRRSWNNWLRRVGLYSPSGTGPPVLPDVRQVIVVGDERRITTAWEASRGVSGGFLAAGADRTVWCIRAGRVGCWVDALLMSPGVQAQTYQVIVPEVSLATAVPIYWSASSGAGPGTAHVSVESLTDAAILALGVQLSVPGAFWGSTMWQHVNQTLPWWPRIWVDRGRSALLIADVADDTVAAIQILEAGDSER